MLWNTISMRRLWPLWRPVVVMSMTPPRESAFLTSSVEAPLAVPSCSFSFIQAPGTSPPCGRFPAAAPLGRHDCGPCDGDRLVRQAGVAAEEVGAHECRVGKRHQASDQDREAAHRQREQDD